MIDPHLDATAQARLVADGEASPQELVEAAIERIEELNPQLNAVVIDRFEKAREEAARSPTGPFAGVPYVIKDHTLVTEGDLHVQGVAGLRRAGLRGDHDSFFVRRMRAAGFVLVGKTNLPELAMSPTTEPAAWGPARNPWDLERSTGGSSGGSAAAVAAAMVPVAEGTDGGGSGRMPAAHCGVIGLKPTRGRISSGPLVNASDNVAGMGTEAILARSIRDVAALLDAVHGHCPGEAFGAPAPARPYVEEATREAGTTRVGVLTSDPGGRAHVHPDCAAAARSTGELLASHGHDVVEAYPARLEQGAWPEAFLPCFALIASRELQRLGSLIGRPLTEADVEPATWAMVQMADGVTARQYAEGVDSLRVYARELEGWWADEGFDLLVTPTLPFPAPVLGAAGHSDEAFIENVEALTPETFTVPYNVSGQPAISLPLHTAANGLPVGVQLVGAWGREDLLLQVGRELEEASPWADRRPPLTAPVGER